MKYCLKNLLIWLCLTVLIFCLASDSLNADKSIIRQSFKFRDNNQAGPRRAFFSDSEESETALVAALDGTISLLELYSMKPLWSFASGADIYSSYQAPVSEDNENSSMAGWGYYIDCGDDWELYAHSRHFKLKLTKTLEEYVNSTPQIAEDGGILHGSKKTTAYLVDAKTGRLIYTYRMPESSTMTENNRENNVFFNNTFKEFGFSQQADLKAEEIPLYIIRTDYALTSFAPRSNEVLWNVTVGEVDAAFFCQESDYAFDGAILDSRPSASDFKMPLPCQSTASVVRFRNHDMFEPFIRPQVPEVGSRDMVLPTPSQAQMLPSQPHADKIIDYLPRNDDDLFWGWKGSKA